jgi:N-formylglutamate amidohydrolase
MIHPFSRLGPRQPASPVLISVPHAARFYPEPMMALARLSIDQLTSLEDRYADLLCANAVADGHSAILAASARGWLDLNRAEDEVDSSMIVGHPGHGLPTRSSTKVRGGLGLIPRRIAKGGEIWRGPLTAEDVRTRIEAVHRPYHDALSEGLRHRVDLFGCALLLDLHSMPPLSGFAPPHLVIGDLFGRSASAAVVDSAIAEVQRAGFRIARNAPYAGGYVLERHASPHNGIHAIQIEVDRSLYLNDQLDAPGAGLATMAQLIRRMANHLAETLRDGRLPLAAE